MTKLEQLEGRALPTGIINALIHTDQAIDAVRNNTDLTTQARDARIEALRGLFWRLWVLASFAVDREHRRPEESRRAATLER